LPDFEKTVEEDALSFKPLGKKIGAFRQKEETEMNGNRKGKGKSTGRELPERSWELIKEGDDAEDDEVLFEAYATNWETPGFKEYHRRMQIFVLLYIEGAQYIDEEDTRWEFVTLCVASFRPRDTADVELSCRFERRKRDSTFTYHFAGFVSFYSFFCWPDTKRLRLA
jgi:histone acetyltransferase 1